ncbi:hypothetical protein EMCG_08412 [[Emmonsia] crescens]|uniref:Chromo domain-containing protein n=1 Tax=[Emmonsia] crescens TaxID=73230 RepID=A0A0G2I586_9EURO|nr:hypothetical protein EMCG_08412 [Emmonsia crescens UAMH 3008]
MANRTLSHNESYLYPHYLGWQGAYIPQESNLPAVPENNRLVGDLKLETTDQIAGQTLQTESVQSSPPLETVESCSCMVEEYTPLKNQIEELNTQMRKLTMRIEELFKDISKLQGSMEKLQPWTEEITNTVYELVNSFYTVGDSQGIPAEPRQVYAAGNSVSGSDNESNSGGQIPPPPVLIEDGGLTTEEWLVDEILESMMVEENDQEMRWYLVKWLGYDPSWQP